VTHEAPQGDTDGHASADIDLETGELQQSLLLVNADKVWSQGYTGQGIVVAVIDSGIDYTHPDFGACSLDTIRAGTCPKIAGAYDFYEDDDDVMDDMGHGTHVAGIIAGTGAMSAGRYRGMAPDARLLIYKVGSVRNDIGFPGTAAKTAQAIAKSLQAAMDPNGDGDTSDHAAVINMSVGSTRALQAEHHIPELIEQATGLGVVVVVAAGNSGYVPLDGGHEVYLSIAPIGSQVAPIVVGAVGQDGQLQSYSARGFALLDYPAEPCEGFDPITFLGGGCHVDDADYELALKPDLLGVGGASGEPNQAAPYPEVVSTVSQLVRDSATLCTVVGDGGDCLDATLMVGESYLRLVGTSMATPQVAGAVALLLQAHPMWTPQHVKAALIASATDVGADVAAQGAGRLDVLAALQPGLLASPSQLDFGGVGAQSTQTALRSVTLTNLSDVVVTYSVSVTFDEVGINPTYMMVVPVSYIEAVVHDSTSLGTLDSNAPATLTLEPLGEVALDLGISFAAASLADGTYGGRVVFSASEHNVTVPFFFFKGEKPKVNYGCSDGAENPVRPTLACSVADVGQQCLYVPLLGAATLLGRCDVCGCAAGQRCVDVNALPGDNAQEMGGMRCMDGNEVCADGTLTGACSTSTAGAICMAPTATSRELVVGKCDLCKSCPDDLTCVTPGTPGAANLPVAVCADLAATTADTCYDGTATGRCSSHYVGYRCGLDRAYQADCTCGCPEGLACDSTQRCVAATVSCALSSGGDPGQADCRSNDVTLYDSFEYQAVCGDGRCTGGENALGCADDCPAEPRCGDTYCDADEDTGSCPSDCQAQSESCTDGTLIGSCSVNKPSLCNAGSLVPDCSTCGCPEAQPVCGADGSCTAEVAEACQDGTASGSCSAAKPSYCVAGVLKPNCDACGCPTAAPICGSNGQCTVDTSQVCSDGTPILNCSTQTAGYNCMPGPTGPVLVLAPPGMCTGSGGEPTKYYLPTDMQSRCEDATAKNACSATAPGMRCQVTPKGLQLQTSPLCHGRVSGVALPL